VEARGLIRGERVHVPAHGVDGPGDLLGRPRRRALEDEVLDQVRDAPAILRLHPRAGLHPYPHRDGADVGHGLGDDTNAVGQHVFSIGHEPPPRAGAMASFSFSAMPGWSRRALLRDRRTLPLGSISMTLTATRSPSDRTSETARIRFSAIWEMCSNPSVPGMIST